jgi:uncharacterized iron-regulated protein
MTKQTAALLCALTMILCVVQTSPAEEPAPLAQTRAEMWLDLYTGEPVEFNDVISDLEQADLIFLGEHHTVARHHHWQQAIIEALNSSGRPLVVGLEMLARKFQPELDRYAIGEIDFDQLAETTEWGEYWGNYEDYKGILEWTREAGIKILALNAPLDVVRKIGRQGIEALTEEERSSLPQQMNLDDPPYFDLMKMQMMVHAGLTEDNLRKIFAAQVARDETMADTMAGYLKSPAGKGRRAIVLCGSGHCSYGYGTVSRLTGRLPDARDRIVIISESGDMELSPEMAKYARDIEISHQQLRDVVRQPLGDYLSIIQPKPTGGEE